jgi:hypothetical protein
MVDTTVESFRFVQVEMAWIAANMGPEAKSAKSTAFLQVDVLYPGLWVHNQPLDVRHNVFPGCCGGC